MFGCCIINVEVVGIVICWVIDSNLLICWREWVIVVGVIKMNMEVVFFIMLCIEIKRFFIDIIKFNIVIVLNDDILNKNLGIFC